MGGAEAQVVAAWSGHPHPVSQFLVQVPLWFPNCFLLVQVLSMDCLAYFGPCRSCADLGAVPVQGLAWPNLGCWSIWEVN